MKCPPSLGTSAQQPSGCKAWKLVRHRALSSGAAWAIPWGGVYHNVAPGDRGAGDVLQRMLSAARRHKVLLDPSFTKLIVGIVTLEGVGRQLDASIDIFSAALPMLSRTDSRTRKAAVGAAAVRAARQAST